MRSAGVWLVAAGIGLAGLGCARKVVLDPDAVASRNDPAWVIRKTPAAAAPAAEQPIAPRPSTAETPPPAPAVPKASPDSR